MVALISFSSFAPPEALLFVRKPKPAGTGTLLHFKILLASFMPALERCLACEAVGVATRRALPRLRGLGNQRNMVYAHSISVFALHRDVCLFLK
jgi:hypothetical protein